MKQLNELDRKLAAGELGFPPATVQKAREIWAAGGYELPPWEPPSLPQKAKNFVVASTRHALSGFKNVPEDVQKARYEICKACPGGYYNPQGDSCKLCGCIMKTKTVWTTSGCPAGYWNRWKAGDPAPVIPSSA